MAEYTPDLAYVRESYIHGAAAWEDDSIKAADFDRFLARVRRDAVEQFVAACKEKRSSPGFLLPLNHWEDIDAAIRVAESYIKNYPETED